MPLSKKRKPKKRSSSQRSSLSPSSSSLPAKGGLVSKTKFTRQQIIIYIVSIAMILSLAIGFLASGTSPQVAPAATPIPSDANSSLDTPTPAAQDSGEGNTPTSEATVEPTAEN